MLTELAPGALLAAFRDAAAGDRDGMAGEAARLSTEAGEARLGWLDPPAWPVVADLVAGYAVPRDGRLLVIGTGGWAFGARAVRDAGPARLEVVDTLDPEALRRAVEEPPAVAVSISESGRTLETRLLTEALAARHGIAARRITGHRLSGHVALFAAPLSEPFLLCASVVAGDDFAAVYEDFARRVPAVAAWAALTAAAAPDLPRTVVLRAEAGDGLQLYLTQLVRQALGGKRGTWFDVTGTGTAPAADWIVDLPGVPVEAHPLTALMLRCYAADALVAFAGARQGVEFATHPAVNRYKRLLPDAAADLADVRTVPAAEILPACREWLATAPELRAAHLVCYDPELARELRQGAGPRWEVHPGSTWNHHSYQAVAGEPEIGVAVVLPARDDDPLLRAQTRIALATGRSLRPRSLLLRPLSREALGPLSGEELRPLSREGRGHR